ncbi:MAG: ribosome maturation factor RimM [Pseudomonadota bacterium]|nr:ribosome maturation factor RimM [Pseudomonadota bacterium]
MSGHGNDFVVVGRITSVFGIKGWAKVASFTEPQDNLLDYGPWLLNEQGRWRTVEVSEIARRSGSKGGFIARFDDCRDRDAAARYTGLDIAVPRAALPAAEADEYYWSDLTGCRVRTLSGEALGAVDRIFATGANDVLVVKGEGRERLIPFTAAAVPKVDLDARVVYVDWDPDF